MPEELSFHGLIPCSYHACDACTWAACFDTRGRSGSQSLPQPMQQHRGASSAPAQGGNEVEDVPTHIELPAQKPHKSILSLMK